MKKKIAIITILATTVISLAQSPNKFSYQAVVRNSAGTLINNGSVGVRISIIQGSANGTTIYAESHTASTNANGLFTLSVGAGNPISGTFAAMNWANGPYFLKSEIDPNGGSAYSAASTSQLLSVPYALHSSSTSSVEWTNVQNKPTFGTGTFSGSYLDLTNKPIITNNTFSGNYTDLANKPALFSGSYNDLTNKPVIINNTFTGSYNDLTNKPIIPASFSGSYLDLSNKPTITTFSGNYLDLSNKPSLAIVATTGSYNDLVVVIWI
ncbi:MAG: hypothetical protein EAZ53_08440 [Bacteroidetes bacterium]|nr:MAG: hypothetical protein EAZ53_08440 [Bacteroidota bacterium]